MQRELKIVVLVFLIFLIFGITSLLQSGQFVTPIFLNRFAFFIVAVLFYLLNRKSEGSSLLLVYVFVTGLFVLIDSFSVNYLSQKTGFTALLWLREQWLFQLLFLIGYFGFFGVISVLIYRKSRQLLLTLLNGVLLLSAVVLLFIPGFEMLRDTCFLLYLTVLIILINRKQEQLNTGFTVLSYQFLLLFLLEGVEYFQ